MQLMRYIEQRQERLLQAVVSSRTLKLAHLLVTLVSVSVVLLFVVTALRRWRYPYELEELEGYLFLTSLRVFHGQPVYVRPSLAFIPYMYPPGYFYATAVLGKVMGMGIYTMRMASILSTLSCFGAIYSLVWTEARRVMPAIAAVGLYAGCYTLCQQWFDLGRLDSFFVMLVLLAMLATRRAHPVLAAAIWTMAFLTKQSILPAAFVMLACDWCNVRRTLGGLVAFAVGVAGSVLWLNHVSSGWYSFYVFAVPGANADIRLRRLLIFWPQEMFRPLLLALMLIVAAALLTRLNLRSRATRFYLAACILVPLFWLVYAHSGSTANAMMPVYALVAVLFGIALARLMAWLSTLAEPLAKRGALLLLLAVVAQEAAGSYNPGDYVPSSGVRSSEAAVVVQIKARPGEVFVAEHPYYAWMAGKPTQADLVSIHDGMRPANKAVRAQLSGELRAAITSGRYSAIFLDAPEDGARIEAITHDSDLRDAHMRASAIPGTQSDTRPDWLLIPSDAASLTPKR